MGVTRLTPLYMYMVRMKAECCLKGVARVLLSYEFFLTCYMLIKENKE